MELDWSLNKLRRVAMLSIKNLTKIYKIKGGNDTRALDNVTLDFPETGMVFLLGKSGSGKSTLLNLIGGLDFPTSGEIILKGRSSKDFSQSDFDSYRNTYIGFIFQEYNILNEFNVEQNIALAIELQGKKVTKEAVDDLLEQVDLTGYGKRKPNTLSGGQKQRIAIARALIKQPNIIMADEPTGALDSKTGEQVFETLKKLSKDKLVIVVSHDRDFAERFGDRIIELKDGQVLSDETKHMVDSTVISDNVTIINEHAIKIEDAKKLTKKDFDKLYESIVKTDGKVFISSGENADKSMKVARISEDGRSDEFKTTEGVELKEYDGTKTTFIRSKMPMGKSVKMGLSSLKTKPVRLVFTIFLSIISFTMFGVASALMLYNSSHTYSEALRKTDYQAEPLSKKANGRYIYQHFDETGKLIDESVRKDIQEVLFSEQEVNDLNNNNLELVYIPVNNIRSRFAFEIEREKNVQYYRDHYNITYVSDASKQLFDKLGYKIEGSYPANDDEILLPKIFGEMFIDSGAFKKSSYTELIGSTIKCQASKGSKNLKISGFFDAGAIPSEYAELTKEDTKLNPEELRELGTKFDEFLNFGYNLTMFTTSKCMEEINWRGGTHNVETSRRAGIRIEMYDYIDERPFEEYDFQEVFTDEIYQNNISDFVIYDLDGNAIQSNDFSLKSDEALVTKNTFENFAYSPRNSLYDTFIYIESSSDLMRLMPTYFEYYRNHQEEIDYLRKNSYDDKEAIIALFNTYKDEFARAYKMERFGREFYGTQSFDNSLNDGDKEQFIAVFNSDGNHPTRPTADEVSNVYQMLVDHFDDPDGCQYRFVKHYLDMVCGVESVRLKLEENPTLFDIYQKWYQEWTSSEVEQLKQFIEQEMPTLRAQNRNWEAFVKGYTFATYQPVIDEIFKADKNVKLYYYSETAGKGSLNVVGYYLLPSNPYYGVFMFNKSFIESSSTEWKDPYPPTPTDYYNSYFESDYPIPEDAKYERLMVKTSYTQEQIAFMKKCNFENCQYDLTSARYTTVYFIVDLISVLKNVFLWVGVGFGVFAALMFLNFITISISSKKKDIGILRAIGARKSDVFKIFFSESLFIAAVCALLSIILTFIAEFFLDRYFIEEIGISILQFSIITVGLVIGVALIVAFIATIFPVIHSSRKPPVESIRAL